MSFEFMAWSDQQRAESRLEWAPLPRICVVATDAFGIEVIRKLIRIDPELQQLVGSEFYWAGEEALPEGASDIGWTSFPPPAADAPAISRLDGEDKVAAQRVSELERLLAQATVKSDSHHFLFLTGSFVNPHTRVVAQHTAENLLSHTRWDNVWRGGTLWALSEETAEGRTATNPSLVDIRQALDSWRKAHEMALSHNRLPCFLVARSDGEHGILATRADSTLILAATMVFLSLQIRGKQDFHSIIDPDSRKTSGESIPLFYNAGAFILRSANYELAGGCAWGTLAAWHKALADQPAAEPDWGPAPKAESNALKEFLFEEKETFLRQLKARLDQGSKSTGRFGFEWIEEKLGEQSSLKTWHEHAESHYGWKRFSGRPLEAWDQDIQDYQSLFELYFAEGRKSYIRAFIASVVGGMDQFLTEVVSRLAWQEQLKDSSRMDFMPSILARRFVAGLDEELALEAKKFDARARDLRDELMEDSLLPRHLARVRTALTHFKRLYRIVPSPVAFLLYLPYIVGFCVVLASTYSSFDLLSLSTEMQMAVKLGTGGVCALATAIILFIMLALTPRRLQKTFARWKDGLIEYYRNQLVRQAVNAQEFLHRVLHDYLKWLGRAGDDGFAVTTFEQSKEDAAGDKSYSQTAFPPDHPLRTLLSGYREFHEQSLGMAREGGDRHLESWKSSPREIPLPCPQSNHNDFLDRILLERGLPSAGIDDNAKLAEVCSGFVQELCRQKVAAGSLAVFAANADNSSQPLKAELAAFFHQSADERIHSCAQTLLEYFLQSEHVKTPLHEHIEKLLCENGAGQRLKQEICEKLGEGLLPIGGGNTRTRHFLVTPYSPPWLDQIGKAPDGTLTLKRLDCMVFLSLEATAKPSPLVPD